MPTVGGRELGRKMLDRRENWLDTRQRLYTRKSVGWRFNVIEWDGTHRIVGDDLLVFVVFNREKRQPIVQSGCPKTQSPNVQWSVCFRDSCEPTP
jgi:hypothetical protein